MGSIARGKGNSQSLAEVAAGLHGAAVILGEGIVGRRYDQFARLCDSLFHLVRWGEAIRSAEVDADRYLRAAKQDARDLAKELNADRDADRLTEAASKITNVSDASEIEQVAEFLLHTPLPLPLFAEEIIPIAPYKAGPTVVTVPEVAVALLSFALHDVAFADPQTIEPDTLHDLAVEIRLSRWPEEAEELVLDVVSVEPPDVYNFPRFTFRRPDGTPPFLLRQTGRMLLRVPQAILSRPLEFAYRAWFGPDSSGAPITVEGQRFLRVQSFDPDRNPQSGYREVDQRLLDIQARARSVPGVRDKELGDFLQILVALGRIAGQALQDNLFPGVWSEPMFQKRMKELLRVDPRIGSELEEHPHAAGGITDLSFHKIRIELKFESDDFVTVKDSQKYLGQTAQYVAGSDRRFGVLCVLDCTPKKDAPGSVVNDIDLLVVPPPRNPSGVPLLVGVVIIRGNLATPSDLSKRK